MATPLPINISWRVQFVAHISQYYQAVANGNDTAVK